MFRDLLSSRLIQAGLVFFVIVVGGSLLYSWYVQRTTEVSELGKRPQPVMSIENKLSTNTALVDFQTEGVVNTPDENTDTLMSDATEAETIDETELVDLVDAFLPDDVVSGDALDPSKMSASDSGPTLKYQRSGTLYPIIGNSWSIA